MTERSDSPHAWLAGLAPAAAKVIKAHGYTSVADVRAAITSGSLTAEFSPQLGEKTLRQICVWSGVSVPPSRNPHVPRIASPQALARAKRTLERAGYTVLAPTERSSDTTDG